MEPRPHKTLEKDGVIALQFTEGEYANIIFSYGKVNFEENNNQDKLKVHFDYEVHEDNGVEYVKSLFENELGDFLIELIVKGTIENNLVYTGGVDAHRKSNIIESDSQ